MEDKYYELSLPSLLIPYSGVEKVEIRMLKGRDEKLIGELTLANFEKKFKTLLGGIVRGIDPGKLTLGDRFYIVVWLAINCYTHLYPIEIFCDTCLRKVKVEIDLGQLEKVDLPKDYREPYALTLTDGSIIHLRQLTVDDQIQYLDYVDVKQKDDLIYKLAQSVVSDDDLVKRMEYLEELSTRDLGLIRGFHDKYYHGVKLESSYTCPKCGGAGVTPVPFRLDIIFPDGQTIARSLGYNI